MEFKVVLPLYRMRKRECVREREGKYVNECYCE